jgi:hypothetical protein
VEEAILALWQSVEHFLGVDMILSTPMERLPGWGTLKTDVKSMVELLGRDDWKGKFIVRLASRDGVRRNQRDGK